MTKNGLRVLFVYADSPSEWNCSQWRQLTPSNAMNRQQENGWSAALMHYTGFLSTIPTVGGDDIPEKNKVALADLIIFQRNIVIPEAIEAIKYWQALGKPVVIDLDDAYHILPPSNPAFNFWIKGAGELDTVEVFSKLNGKVNIPTSRALTFLEDGLKVSAGLISPNRNLLNAWSHCVGDKKYYLQNYAEKEWWEDLPPREDVKKKMGLENKIVIGWGGSVSHLDSFWGSGLYQALTHICHQHPNVVIKICGSDERLTTGLQGVSTYQIIRQYGVPPNLWPEQVRSFDIGLAPLFGFYDQHRSWIKGIEYLLAGTPWVGTIGGPDGTYADLQGLGYLIENDSWAWENTLKKIIDNLEAEQNKAEALIPMAQKRFIIDHNLDIFATVYHKIIADFKRDGAGANILLPEVAHVG
jgi:hypothetical protein